MRPSVFSRLARDALIKRERDPKHPLLGRLILRLTARISTSLRMTHRRKCVSIGCLYDAKVRMTHRRSFSPHEGQSRWSGEDHSSALGSVFSSASGVTSGAGASFSGFVSSAGAVSSSGFFSSARARSLSSSASRAAVLSSTVFARR